MSWVWPGVLKLGGSLFMPVMSVFGRVGAVVAVLGDYAAGLVTNDSVVEGATVKDALDNLSLFDPASNQIISGFPLPSLPTTFGPIASAGVIGTATARVPDNTSYGARKLRVGFVSPASLNGQGMFLFYSAYAGAAGYFSRESGFALQQDVLLAAVSPNLSWMLGVGIAADFSVLTPSTRTNAFFVGADSTDTNAQLMYNDGSGSCTKVNLGANFPARTAGDFYELLTWCTPGSASINYVVTRHTSLGAVFSVSGTITGANVPVAGTFWYPMGGGNTGAASTSIAVDTTGFCLAVPH
jgi:hypothetical protein